MKQKRFTLHQTRANKLLITYSKKANIFGSLWNYYRDELTDEEPDDNDPK